MIHRSKGFTLVELTLSMAFIGLLLLAIAILTLQISSVYNKGLTLRAANEAGQLISADIQREFNQATPQATKFVEKPDTNPTGGRLCSADMVYAWNYNQYLGSTNAFNKMANGNSDIRMVNFKSLGNDYCTEVNGAYPVIPAYANNMLPAGDANLAIGSFKFNASSVQDDNSQRIFRFEIVLGTNTTGSIQANGCNSSYSTRVDDEYCAVNEFKFTARAGNKSEEN